MRAAWLIVALLACKGSEHSNERTKPSLGKNIVDDDVKRALVLDAALKKLEHEIAELEASPSADPVVLAQKKDALQALRSTLTKTQRRIDFVKGSGATAPEPQ